MSSERGASLIELFIALAITAIVLAGLVSGFRHFSTARAHQAAVTTANAEVERFLSQFKRQWAARARTNAAGLPTMGFQGGAGCNLNASPNGCPSIMLTIEDSVRGSVSVPVGTTCSSTKGSRASLDYSTASDCLRCTGSQAPSVSLDTRNLSNGGRVASFPPASSVASGAAVSLSVCFMHDGTANTPLSVTVQTGIIGANDALHVVRKTATLPIDNFADVTVLGR